MVNILMKSNKMEEMTCLIQQVQAVKSLKMKTHCSLRQIKKKQTYNSQDNSKPKSLWAICKAV